MTKEQDTGLFELPIKPVETEEELERLLNPHQKTIGRGKSYLRDIYGPGDYVNIGKHIEKEGLLKPTMAETVSLIHKAFNSKGRFSNAIRKLTEKRWLWSFTGILYVPNKGAYIQDDPEIRNGNLYMEESDLVKKLNSPSVRFVPFGYKIGEMTPKELKENELVIGLVGKKGAVRLSEVAEKHKDKPDLRSFESVDKFVIRVPPLFSNYEEIIPNYECVHKLVVDGNFSSYEWAPGYAFGVQKNTDRASLIEK